MARIESQDLYNTHLLFLKKTVEIKYSVRLINLRKKFWV